MEQSFFVIILIAALGLCVLPINAASTFAHKKNETAIMDDSALVTTADIG